MAGLVERGRWSGAVREAFLASLARQGQVKQACAAVGMTVASAYQLRARDADFARAWAAAVERARKARAARQTALILRNPALPDYRIRCDGWTEARRKIFLRALSETGCVRDACARAAISSHSAYRLRAREPGFARAWQRALAKAAPTLEQAAFERAVHGWEDVVTRDGKELSRRRRYSDSLLRLLIQRGDLDGKRARATDDGARPAIEAPRAPVPAVARQPSAAVVPFRATEEETNEALRKKLDMVARQERLREAERHAAQWERWKQCWGKMAGWGRPLPQRLPEPE